MVDRTWRKSLCFSKTKKEHDSSKDGGFCLDPIPFPTNANVYDEIERER